MVKNKETERVLVTNLEGEIKGMLQEMHGKDRQLYDQNELITLLVQKLFFVYKTLRRVDDATAIMKMEEEQDALYSKIRTLESDNEKMKESIIKAKKNLEKLEEKAEKYLEERDNVHRKHRESLEMIETLQKENRRSKETMQTLEEEKKTALNKLQAKMMQELEDYEKKHRNSLEKLETLRAELQSTKKENQSSLTKVKTLSDENRSQAETITSLREKMRKFNEKPDTATTGVNCKPTCRDTGVDPCCPSTRCIGVENIPETKTTGTLSDIESQIVPTSVAEQMAIPQTGQYLRTIACETESPAVNYRKREQQFETITTVNSYEEVEREHVYMADKPPILKRKENAQVLENLDTERLVTFGLPKDFEKDAFDFVKTKLIADSDERNINRLLQAEVLDKVGVSPGDRYRQLQVYKPVRETQYPNNQSYKAEVIYNGNNMFQSSNESMRSDEPEDVFNQAFVDKRAKSVRMDTKVEGKLKDGSKECTDEDSDNISATYYSAKDSNVNDHCYTKKEVFEVERKRKRPVKIPAEGSGPSTSPERVGGFQSGAAYGSGGKGRPTSPKISTASSSNAADELQTVVQDLNESVSRIMEKSPNEKATRLKIAKLEEQLRAVNRQLESIRNTDTITRAQRIDNVNDVQIQLQALKQKEREVELERQRRSQEVENLKLTIREMEKALQNKEMNAINLQSAVDLYLNSISVLEQSEERYKSEVTQQRITISNLQEALVTTKQQLDELRQKCQNDLEEKCVLLDILDVSLSDLEKQCYHYYNQYLNSAATVEYLRDDILDLEVEKFDLLQDVLVLESTLLKYQQTSKQYECICGLKREIKRLHTEVDLLKAEVENLQDYIRKCHKEIDSTKIILGKYLGQECSEYCIKQDESVLTLAQDTISFTEDLQCQMAVLETALKREQKINMVQANRIEELQNIIGAKNIELSRANDAYQDAKAKLDAASSKSRIFEEAIQDLQEQLKDIEMDNIFKEEKADICHGELDICLNNLQSVKLKLRSQYKAMCQKMQDFTQLQADYRIQVNNTEMFKRDLENTRIRSRDEIIELKHNIRDLKEKLAMSDDKIECLNQEVKHSQVLLAEAAHHEVKIKQDFFMREKELTEKIHSAQEEEMRLLDVVTQLEQQITGMKIEIDSRGNQLEAAKQTVLQMTTDSLMKQQMTQEEINKLKNEINTLLQQQGAQKAENDRLHKQIECMKCCIHQNEVDNKNVQQQLEKCMSDMKNMETDKYYLEQRNVKLMEALDKMQVALQTRTENIATMEMELLEAKTSRDEICTESRNVVFNVRAWLEEQKRINEQLKEKLQKKNAQLARYEQEKKKGLCDCSRTRDGYPRQRGGGTVQSNYFQNKPPSVNRSHWSLDSRGSGSESSNSSASSTHADWYEYEEVEYNAIEEEPTTEVWIHRVESMTEELQRSNRYWKKKINDSEFMVSKDK